jgi:hypothetical protein
MRRLKGVALTLSASLGPSRGVLPGRPAGIKLSRVPELNSAAHLLGEDPSTAEDEFAWNSGTDFATLCATPQPSGIMTMIQEMEIRNTEVFFSG